MGTRTLAPAHGLASLPLTICLLGLAEACDPAGLVEAEGLSMHGEAGGVDVSCSKTQDISEGSRLEVSVWGGEMGVLTS